MVEDQDQMLVCTIAKTRASFLRLRKFSARQPDAYCERKTKKNHKILQITACTTSLSILCQSMPEYERVSQSMPEYARVCQSMTEYARVCQSKPEYARVCQSMPEYARVCHSMPEY